MLIISFSTDWSSALIKDNLVSKYDVLIKTSTCFELKSSELSISFANIFILLSITSERLVEEFKILFLVIR